MQIKDSVALVTGANRGIGRAFVGALLAGGARRVYASARTVASLDAVVRLDARVTAVQLDVTNAAEAQAAAALAKDVTLLVNNAGTLNAGTLTDVPVASVRADMETNYFGTLSVVNAFAPVIEKNGGGAIVNILSVVSFASMPGIAAYNASKAAEWSLTQSFRAGLGARGIAVHGVFPGPVDTDMARGFDMAKTPPAEIAKATLAGIEKGEEDIFPDAMSQQVYGAWTQDHKAVERQFAAM
jgi:NAD(P)-dependent dehydrogenase (short-subunit alcohol dehydrogenase family)